MEKTRIINNSPAQSFPVEWIEVNKDNFINGAFVKDWVLAPKYEGNFIKPLWNGTDYYEGATPEDINAYNKSLVPENVRSRQLRLALVYSGFNLEDISTAIESLQEPNKSIAKIEWEYATSFDRNNQLLISLGSMLNLTEIQIDELFKLANTL